MAKLVRPKDGRMLLGVCAGLADWWNINPNLLRVLYVLVSLCSAAFPGVLAYVILGILMPPQD